MPLNLTSKFTIAFVVILTCANLVIPVWSFENNSSYLTLLGQNSKIILETSIDNFSGVVFIPDGCRPDLIQSTTSDTYFNLDQGCLKSVYGETVFSGSFIPNNDNPFISIKPGSIINITNRNPLSIIFSGTNNTIVGSPSLEQDLVLSDSATVLEIGINNKLDRSITLNGGTILFLKDLSLKEGVTFSGDGIIDLNNFTFNIPENFNLPWAGNLTLINASDISLKYPCSISGSWTFEGSGQKSTVLGRYNTIDMSSGGTFIIGANHILELSHINLKGLGNDHGKIIIDPTGQLLLTSVTLDFSTDLNISAGKIIINSNDCNIITRQATSLTLSGSSTELVLDGYLLHYDSINNPGFCPVQNINQAKITKLNNGNIISGSLVNINPSIDFYLESSMGDNSITSNINLGPTKNLKFISTDHNSRKSMTLNAQGNQVSISNSDQNPVIFVDENIDLCIKNIVLDGFSLSKVYLAGTDSSAATINFGNNVTLKQTTDIILNTPLKVFGTTTLDCNGFNTDFTSTSLTLTDSGCLTIKNGRIFLNNSDIFNNISDSSFITLQDTHLFLNDSGCIFNKGFLSCKGQVNIHSINQSTDQNRSQFIFSSKQTLTLMANSSLILNHGTTLICNPDTSLDQDLSQKKRHFLFEDPSAKLILSSAYFDTGLAGIAFDYGTIDIFGNCLFLIPDNDDAAIELSEDLNLIIEPDATIGFNGPVKYA